MTRTARPRKDARRTSTARVIAIVALFAAAILWCAITSYAQDASWRRYVESGCPRPVEAETRAYQEFLAPEQF